MKIIDRLKQWRDLCDVYGSEFLFMTDGHKQSYVTDMYSMLRLFFVDEIDIIDKFYFIFFHIDSYVVGLMWTKLANYLRRSWSKAEEFSN